jgi:hypothetical protein
MSNSRKLIWITACSLSFILITIPAYGYTDPNTVGLISQILTPLVITAGATLTFLRKRIVTALSGLMQRLRGKADVSQG